VRPRSAAADAPSRGRPSPADLRRQRSHLLRGILASSPIHGDIHILGASASAVGSCSSPISEPRDSVGIAIVVFGTMLMAMAARRPPCRADRRAAVHRPPFVLGPGPSRDGDGLRLRLDAVYRTVLGSVLTLAAGNGIAHRGIALLLAYSIGSGPFLLSGLPSTDDRRAGRVRSRLRVVDLVAGDPDRLRLLLLTGNVGLIADHLSNWFRDLHLDRCLRADRPR